MIDLMQLIFTVLCVMGAMWYISIVHGVFNMPAAVVIPINVLSSVGWILWAINTWQAISYHTAVFG